MKRIPIVLALLVLLMGVCAWSQTSPQKAGNPLNELGDLLVGRWMGEVTLAYDYPGIGKKGEKISEYDVNTWIADKTAIELEWFAGKTTGKGLIAWDAASKEIKGFSTDSSGRFGQFTFTKQGGKWVYSGTGSFVDGRKSDSKGSLTFLDNNNTYIEEGTIIVGNEKNNYRDTYKRVSK
jgi:hypothetical protein